MLFADWFSNYEVITGLDIPYEVTIPGNFIYLSTLEKSASIEVEIEES